MSLPSIIASATASVTMLPELGALIIGAEAAEAIKLVPIWIA